MQRAQVNKHVATGLVALLTGVFMFCVGTEAPIDLASQIGLNYEQYAIGLKVIGGISAVYGIVKTCKSAAKYGIGPTSNIS